LREYEDIEEFTFVGFKIEIKKDTSKNWRIYVKKNDRIKIMPYDIPVNYDEYGYMGRDSSFSLEGFPYALWNYGDQIGLDQFPYSKESQFKFHKDEKVFTLEQIRKLAKDLVDRIIDYQVNFNLINEFRRFDSNVGTIQSVGNKIYEKKNLVMLKKFNDILENVKANEK
jgi:hypothetical protein